jgi:hypothetical protein
MSKTMEIEHMDHQTSEYNLLINVIEEVTYSVTVLLFFKDKSFAVSFIRRKKRKKLYKRFLQNPVQRGTPLQLFLRNIDRKPKQLNKTT